MLGDEHIYMAVQILQLLTYCYSTTIWKPLNQYLARRQLYCKRISIAVERYNRSLYRDLVKK